jgi:hypothetical protein
MTQDENDLRAVFDYVKRNEWASAGLLPAPAYKTRPASASDGLLVSDEK